MKAYRSAAILAGILALGSVAARAHHSAAMFDRTRVVVVDGTVKSFLFQSPHVWLSVVANPEGKKDGLQWDVEAVAPVSLMGMGITRNTFKPGDKVSVWLYPLKDGRHAGSLINITNADGKVFGPKFDKPADAVAH